MSEAQLTSFQVLIPITLALVAQRIHCTKYLRYPIVLSFCYLRYLTERIMLLDATVIFLVVLLAVCFHLLQTYLQLRHVPGPFLASLSDIWRWYTMNLPGHGEHMVQLHRKYGPFIRVGPHRVSTSDPSMIPIVFATTSPWEKVSNCALAASR